MGVRPRVRIVLGLGLVVAALAAGCQSPTVLPTATTIPGPPTSVPSSTPTIISAVLTATPSAPTPIANSDDLMNQELFEGTYASGFETSAFVPCGLSEKWWVTPDSGEVGEELVRAYNAISSEQFKDAYALVRGKLSERGTYGHLGMYERIIIVTEVIDVRKRQEGDCQTPAASPTLTPASYPTSSPSSTTPPASLTANATSDEIMNQDLFEGSLAFSIDTRTFAPCGVSEDWWVSSENPQVLGKLITDYNALSPDKLKNAFARLKGELSPRGSYGLLGVYERTFWVTEIVELRQREEGDCKPG